jgi:hypothetical protein
MLSAFRRDVGTRLDITVPESAVFCAARLQMTTRMNA